MFKKTKIKKGDDNHPLFLSKHGKIKTWKSKLAQQGQRSFDC